MKAFGIRKGKVYHWTIEIKEKGRFIPGLLTDAYSFTTNVTDGGVDAQEEIIMAKLVEIMR